MCEYRAPSGAVLRGMDAATPDRKCKYIRQNMLSWLFGNSSPSYLVLHPDSSAFCLPGFKEGADLHLTASHGDTIGSVMERFNTYRGPDQQITTLWGSDGKHLPYSTSVTGVVIGIVKKTS